MNSTGDYWTNHVNKINQGALKKIPRITWRIKQNSETEIIKKWIKEEKLVEANEKEYTQWQSKKRRVLCVGNISGRIEIFKRRDSIVNFK